MRDPLDSYYFGFGSTGVPEIDDVLAAVARAGRAYHSTEFWSDTDYGQSETSKIQDAAFASAEILKAKDAELTSLKAENEALKEALRQIASFQEGPEITGSFDEPCSARIAREALSQSKTEAS